MTGADFAAEASQTFITLGHRTDGGDIFVDDVVLDTKLVAMTCGLCGHLFTYDSRTRKVLGGVDNRPFVSQTCTVPVPKS
jgi:hypothetical protein